MGFLKDYCKAFFQTRDVEELIPFAAFVADGACITKCGSAVATLAAAPIDDECLSENWKEYYTSSVLAAHNLLGPNARHYQYLFRTRQFSVPDRAADSQNELVRQLEAMRRNHLLTTAKGAEIEMYQAIELLPEYSPAQLARLTPRERRRETRRLISDLDLLCRAYEIALPALELQRHAKQESFDLFHRLLHTGRPWHESLPLRGDAGLAHQLRRISVSWDVDSDCLRCGSRPVRVFTMQELPDNSAPNLFGELLEIDADLTIVSTWQAQERITAQEQLTRLRTLMINLERNTFGTRRAMREDPSLRDDLANAGVRDDLQEINRLMAEIRRKKHTGTYSLTVLVHGDKPEDLDRPAAEISRVFRMPNARLHEENGQFLFGAAIPTFFGILPGNAPMNALRTHPLRNDHYARLSLIWGPDPGEVTAEHANLYETRQGPLHRVASRNAMVANRLVTGMTRQGKTAFEIDSIGALQVRNPLTRIYDVGSSYESLARHFGGSVLHCDLGSWKTKTNPFHGPVHDPNFHEFCKDFVRLLAESDRYTLTVDDMLQLERTLNGLLRLKPQLRRLSTLVANLHGDLKYVLKRWCEGGQYGHLFDHAEDELIASEFQIFEFAKANDGIQHAYLEALQMLLIYRDTQTFLDPALRGRLKHITFDECVSHWRHPRMGENVKRLLKEMQKFNCSLSLVTQSPEDLASLEPFVLQNCSSFVFFANSKADDFVLRKFGMHDELIEVFRGLRPREFLYHALRGKREDLWKVLKLTLDPYRYWMYTTTPDEVVLRDKIYAEYGQTEGLKRLSAAGGAA